MTEMTNRSSSKMDIKAGLRPWSNIQKGKEETTGRQTKNVRQRGDAQKRNAE